MFVVDRKRSQSATKTRSSSLLLGCPFMVPSRLRGPRRGAGPPRALFGQEREGPPRALRVLADRAPVPEPQWTGQGFAGTIRPTGCYQSPSLHPKGTGRALLDIETRSANSLERIARLGAGVGCTREGCPWRTSFLQGMVRCSIA